MSQAGDQASDIVTVYLGMQPPHVIQYSASNVCLLQEIYCCMPPMSELELVSKALFFFSIFFLSK